MQAPRIITALMLMAMIMLTGCGGSSQEDPATAPAEEVTQASVDQVFQIGLEGESENIRVELQQVQLVRDADFGEGRRSDALILSLFVDNQNTSGLQLHPDSGRILLNTGEELQTPKGIYHETYPNGTLKKGDIYFPLQLTRLNEISEITILLDGPVNQYYDVMGEGFAFEVSIGHPEYQPVSRETLVERVYQLAARMGDAPGVTTRHHLGHREEIGPLTVHVMELLLYENVEHPFAAFLNLEEPVNFIGLALAVENPGDQTAYYSNARTRLQMADGGEIMLDQLMSQYMSQEYHPGAIKFGTAFFRVEQLDEEMGELSLILDGAYERIGVDPVLLAEGPVIQLAIEP